ncbi:AraC family transcriptional regulator [Bradyrhizobium elkanii]
MSKPVPHNLPNDRPATSDDRPDGSPLPGQHSANTEMARVLKTRPVRFALEPSGGSIAYWQHDPVHEIVKPMADHVIMAYPAGIQRLERRSGKSVAIGTARPGVVTVIPAGATSRWDVVAAGSAGRADSPQLLNLIQLYVPHTTLERIASEADLGAPADLTERIGHPDAITARLLTSGADLLENNTALDTLFRQQLTDLLATRLLVAHSGSAIKVPPAVGGLSPSVLRRAIERLRSDSDADVSLAALASDAGLSRFHFCRAFKESTGLSPHAFLRQHRLEQAMKMLRDTDASVVTVSAALGYASQTAFAAAFRRLTGDTPSSWRRRMR